MQVEAGIREENWKYQPLGDVCTVIAGQSPRSSAYNERGEGLPFYQGKKDFTDRYLAAPATWTKSITKTARPGDILMSVRAPVGPINETREKICIGRGLAAIRASQDIDHSFLWYALLWLQPKIIGNAGAVFPSINKKSIEALTVPIPPLDEQKRIVAVLDQAFAGLNRVRTQVEANLDDSRKLFAGTLEQSFVEHDKTQSRSLSELIAIEHGCAFKSKQFIESEDESLPIILTPGNYSEDGRLYFRQGKTKRFLFKPPADLTFKVGELTIVMTDLSSKMKILGKPAFIDRANILHNQRIGRIKFLTDDVNDKYLYYFLRSKRFSEEIKSTATGTMVRHTAPKRILACRVPVPSPERQKEVVQLLETIEQKCLALRSEYEARLSQAANLRQFLLQKAFSGELV